jgi:hypothetical protein
MPEKKLPHIQIIFESLMPSLDFCYIIWNKICITCIYSSFAELLSPLFAVLSGSPAV